MVLRPLWIFLSFVACGCNNMPAATDTADTTSGSPDTVDAPSTAEPVTTTTAPGTADDTSSGGTPTTGEVTTCAPIDPNALVTVHGVVQKGPYTAGAEVTLTVLGPDGEPTDRVFVGATVDDLGTYSVAGVPTGPVLVEVRGTYYDELADTITAEPLTLRAFGRATGDEPINVNVATHILVAHTRALFAAGTCLEDLYAQAQGALWRIPTGVIDPLRPAAWSSITGDDDDDNAFLLALGAIFQQAAHDGADLQQLLDALDADNAADPDDASDLVGPLWAAADALPAALVHDRLVAYLQSKGQPPQIPNIQRALDQDHDGIPNATDNCPFVPNVVQGDGNENGIGDLCDCGACDCGFQAPDGDDDAYPDECDTCPDVPNSSPSQDNPYADFESDGLGDACDSCPQSIDIGAQADDQCCDPRWQHNSGWGGCEKFWWGNIGTFACVWDQRFQCTPEKDCFSDQSYGQFPCDMDPTAPAGALAPVCDKPGCDCDNQACATKWCTLDDDDECDGDLNKCIPWFKPGEAPSAFDTLGVCARTDQGPCVGKVGRECVQ